MWVRLLLLGATFTLSTALALYLTPFIRRGAIAFGVLDHPDGALKTHEEPTPYLGGIAIYLAFLITLGVVFDFEPRLLGLLLGGTMVAMLGLFDDLRVLPARLKLAGQLLAIWVVMKSGVSIQLEALPTAIAIPLTIAWVAGITNAFNIIDVSDGLSSGVAAIAAVALFIIAILNGDLLIATTTLALAGSVVGFLRYNQPPASIYMGDTGSMFVGFMIAVLSLIGAYTERSVVGFCAPLLILIVPILDTTLVTFARLRRGESPLRGSPDHFAVRLRRRSWSAKKIATYAYGLGLIGAVAGVAVILVDTPTALGIAGGGALLFWVNLIWLWRLPQQAAAETPVVRALQPSQEKPVAWSHDDPESSAVESERAER